ncbi:MAG: NusG domain II-containing protein [Treponema sp.]|jgi:hypothetical protein|nr:NusG domain II-containing protein [Treponema sp.]
MAGPGFKPFDFVSLFAALIIIFLAFIPIYSGAGAQNTIKLKGEAGAWVFPQEAEETLTVPGPLGDTVVEIHGGRARVLSSPCQNQTCVAAGTIHARGQWIACLPNRVLVSVESSSGEDTEIDAAAW